MFCSVFIATSIDGFIATRDGGLEWLEEYGNPDGQDHGYSDFMARVDAIVMGRRTFEKVLGFGAWPYEKPVYVLTRAAYLESASEKARVVPGGPPDVVEYARAHGHTRLYVDGGRTIQSFLEHDLIDEMIITTIPIVLGSGIPLFGDGQPKRRFEVANTSMSGAFAQVRFVRKRDGAAR
jgi:dihydrofolate reductase